MPPAPPALASFICERVWKRIAIDHAQRESPVVCHLRRSELDRSGSQPAERAAAANPRPLPKARRFVSGAAIVISSILSGASSTHRIRSKVFVSRGGATPAGAMISGGSIVRRKARNEPHGLLGFGADCGRLARSGLRALHLVARQELSGQFKVGLSLPRIAHRTAPPVCRGWALQPVERCAESTVVNSRSLKYSRRVSVTCCARLVRSSYMVSSTPSIVHLRIEGSAHPLQRRNELRNPLQREILGLHRHNERVRRRPEHST